jgi:small subunit ribosomal protein S13
MEQPDTQKPAQQKPVAQPRPAAQPTVEDRNFRHLVRIMNTDLDGNKPISYALLRIKGISFIFSNAICKVANLDMQKKTGTLSDDEVARLEDALGNPLKYSIPAWMLNRRKDYDDGMDRHLYTSDITYAVDNDIKRLKKIKAYKGIRHMLGQPVRGQRTKSNFRKNKGKVMGVKRSKVVPGSAEASPKERGKK